MGRITATTQAQFTYGLDSQNRASHYVPNPGLIGGTTRDVTLFTAVDLANIHVYAKDDFPNTAGFTVQEGSGLRQGTTVLDAGVTYEEFIMVYLPSSAADVTRRFYAVKTDLAGATTEAWMQYGDQVAQL